MSEIPIKCKICKGGCCEDDIQLYGFLPRDILNLAIFNLVTTYLPKAFLDVDAMYLQLKIDSAPDGYYILPNDQLGKDVDGIRLGPCKACLDGVCLLEAEKPHPCRMMDYEGPTCLKIFSRRLSKNNSLNEPESI